MIGSHVNGKTIGIVGGGRIGMAVAKRAMGFNVEILYTDVKPNAIFEETTDGKYCSKEELLKNSDFISLHIPLLDSTRHYIDYEDFELMKNSAILVNEARGPIINEKALVDALKNNKIKGAGLDVFEKEPNLEPGLADLDNVIFTPHVGTATLDTRIQMGEGCAKSIFTVIFENSVPGFCVNPEIKS